jgi:glycosyltransferase involved in cell wall biosynthesis
MMLSLIVPAYNEEVMIGETLRTLVASARSVGEPFELIVVDDASTDATAAIARAHGASVLRVDLHRISAVRNAGARTAQGELLVFVDADTLVPPETLAQMLDAVRGGAIGGGARVRLDEHGLPWWARALSSFTCWLVYRLRIAGGCFVFARREAFDAVGGFDERYFASEEIHFGRALKKKGRFVLIPAPVMSSGRKLRLFPGWQLLRQMLRFTVRGWPALRRREGLEFWYDGRREPTDRRPSRGRDSILRQSRDA